MVKEQDTRTAARTEVPLADRERHPGWPGAVHCRFAVLSDLHVRAGEMRDLAGILARIKAENPDFVVFLGDTNHGQGDDDATLAAHLTAARELAAGLPAHFVMGNTDMAKGPDPGRVFVKVFGTTTRYAFDAGGVHFVVLDTNGGAPARFGVVEPEQFAWLQADLAALAPATPVVLFSHHAIYVPERWGADHWGITNSRELFAVLAPHRVVASFSGHRHLNRMSLDRRGALHTITGPLYGDHSDDVGPKKDGVGYRGVEVTPESIATWWVQVGFSDLAPEY